MKSTIRTFTLAALFSIASLSQTLHAQISDYYGQFDVTFAFDYGTQHFSAGHYTIAKDGDFLILRGSRRVALGMLMIQGQSDPRQAARSYVVFRKYGNSQYFLEEYYPADTGMQLKVVKSKAELRAARELAANHVAPSTELAWLGTTESSKGN